MPEERAAAPPPRYRRVLLKLSGECFAPPEGRAIAMDAVVDVARQIHQAADHGVEIGVVVGGGNILRGGQFVAEATAIRAQSAHTMGMLATLINGLALQDALESVGAAVRLTTALRADAAAEPYLPRRARHHLRHGRIVILAGGTGSPFVTTDTAAAQRAIELEADVLLKATRVDGVYSDDPEQNAAAVLYDRLRYDQVLQQDLRVMDAEAIAKCMVHALPILVFNYRKPGNIVQAVLGEKVGTLVSKT